MANSGVHEHRYLVGVLSYRGEGTSPARGANCPKGSMFTSLLCLHLLFANLLVLICSHPTPCPEVSRTSCACPPYTRGEMEGMVSSSSPSSPCLHPHTAAVGESFWGWCGLALHFCSRMRLGGPVSQSCLHQSLSWGCSDGAAHMQPSLMSLLPAIAKPCWFGTRCVSSSWPSGSAQEGYLLLSFHPCIHHFL